MAYVIFPLYTILSLPLSYWKAFLCGKVFRRNEYKSVLYQLLKCRSSKRMGVAEATLDFFTFLREKLIPSTVHSNGSIYCRDQFSVDSPRFLHQL